ncbi:signal peptidase I [bacterium]|nr:MAG: signal peptidase I [bacterium]
MVIIALIYLAIVVLMIASLWIIFTKAGKPGWACLIPIYNIIVLLEIVGKPWWWLLLMLIPLLQIVFIIIVIHNLSLSFGKSTGFTVGLILLGVVFYPMLAFGDATYTAPAKSS